MNNREKLRELNRRIDDWIAGALVKLLLMFLQELVKMFDGARRAELRRSQPIKQIESPKINIQMNLPKMNADLVGERIKQELEQQLDRQKREWRSGNSYG